MAITPLNFLTLRNGQFDATNRPQLKQAFDAFATGNTKKLVIHFHGGLVNEKNATHSCPQRECSVGDLRSRWLYKEPYLPNLPASKNFGGVGWRHKVKS